MEVARPIPPGTDRSHPMTRAATRCCLPPVNWLGPDCGPSRAANDASRPMLPQNPEQRAQRGTNIHNSCVKREIPRRVASDRIMIRIIAGLYRAVSEVPSSSMGWAHGTKETRLQSAKLPSTLTSCRPSRAGASTLSAGASAVGGGSSLCSAAMSMRVTSARSRQRQ